MAVNTQKRVSRISGYLVPVGKHLRAMGRCHSKGRRYNITVALNHTRGFVSIPLSLEDVLITVAHELAHTVEWEHTPKHLALTTHYLKIFARVAKRIGIKDTSKPPKRVKNDK